ncbi:MAG: hypothetical protein D6723_07770 [Acidobacteria bacterium]|nr:MAG: hypothetical protein D6723_07770 [Acidobacteriota bacterium]
MRHRHRNKNIWIAEALIVASLVVVALSHQSIIGGRAQATTITVDTTSDVADFGGAQRIGDLPGPDGVVSLREAIIAANNTPGSETIAFNIPTSDPGFNGTFFTIRVENTPPLALSDNGITIDGTTQTAFTGDTDPNGPEIHLSTIPPLANLNGLTIDSSNNAVIGLGGFINFRYGIELNGSDNEVRGCFIDSLSAGIHITGSNNTIGGLTPEASNLISSGGNGIWIRFASATGNVIQGNTITGNHTNGIDIEEEASGNIIGGTTEEARNVIHSNGHLDGELRPVGSQISLAGDNNVVQGNYLGVDETGTQDVSGSARSGISITGSFNTIGGAEPGAGNVISGHGFTPRGAREGINISGGTGNIIQGNFIGTDASGTVALPNESGIVIRVFLASNTPHDITIGGTAPGAANVIAFNEEGGLVMTGFGTSQPTGVTISGNSIFDNGQLGIDLSGDGVTPNDAGDSDTGANALQNFPTLTSATNSSSTTIEGTLNSISNTSFVIEFFSNAACDPSNHGEGEHFLGSTTVSTDESGDASFMVTLAETVPTGHFITATATDPDGNTSEFSPCIEVGSSSSATCSLDPATATNPVGTDHTVTVSVMEGGTPAPGVTVTFDVTAGPNAGTSGTGVTDANGQVSFTYTSNGQAGTDTIEASGSVNDASFSCTATKTWAIPASITVIAPNGGETWSIGSAATIQWSTSGQLPSIDNVTIQLSRDGGATFQTIIASTPNDGAHSWSVTGPATTEAVIKILDALDATIWDISDGTFIIEQDAPPPSPPPGNCAATTAVEGTPDAAATLELLHHFRDEVLSQNARGRQFIEQFEQFSPEAVNLLLFNPELLLATQTTLRRFIPTIRSLVERRRATVTRDDVTEMERLLNAFRAVSSPALQRVIDQWKRDLRNPTIQREFGIQVQ